MSWLVDILGSLEPGEWAALGSFIVAGALAWSSQKQTQQTKKLVGHHEEVLREDRAREEKRRKRMALSLHRKAEELAANMYGSRDSLPSNVDEARIAQWEELLTHVQNLALDVGEEWQSGAFDAEDDFRRWLRTGRKSQRASEPERKEELKGEATAALRSAHERVKRVSEEAALLARSTEAT